MKIKHFWARWKFGYIPTVPPHWIHFARPITRPWVGLLGWLWYILVEEGLTIFLRYSGPMSVDGKVFKNLAENWKIAILAFFVNQVKCPNLHNKVQFLYCLLTMGMGGIDTDTIGHSRLGILGTNPTFVGQKVWQCDSCHTVPSSIITFGSFYNATNHLLLWQVSHNNLSQC